MYLATTLRDQHHEREYLLKRIFPELRRACEARGIRFILTELHGHDHAEHASRQFERFREILRTPGLHIVRLFSELEGPPAAIDEKLVKQLHLEAHSPSWRTIETDLLRRAQDDVTIFTYLPTISRSRLQQIKEVGAQICFNQLDEANLRVGPLNVEQLANCVRSDLFEQLNARFPESQTNATAHHLLDLTERSHELIELDDRVKSAVNILTASNTLVMTGLAGSGKTSLLAMLYRQALTEGALVIPYSVRVGEAMSDTMPTYFSRAIGKLDSAPGESHGQAREQLPLQLARLGELSVYLLVDGLELLDPQEPLLTWVPYQLPSNVKLIVATSESSHKERLTHRGFAHLELGTLSSIGVHSLVDHLIEQYGLSLTLEQRDRIVRHPLAFHPQFLVALFSELRQFGWFKQMSKDIDDHLDDNRIEELLQSTVFGASSGSAMASSLVMSARLDFYLKSHSLVELYERVLERMELDFGAPQVIRVLSYLAASVEGLALDDLVALSNIPAKAVEEVIFGLEENAAYVKSSVSIQNEYLRKAIYRRFMWQESVSSAVHGALIDRLRHRPRAEAALEIALHYRRAGNREALKRHLLDAEYAEHLIKLPSETFLGLWRSTSCSDSFEREYLAHLSGYNSLQPISRRVEFLNCLSEFLIFAGKFMTAREVLEITLAATSLDVSLAIERAHSFQLLGRTYYSIAHYGESESAYKRAVEVLSHTLGAMHMDTLSAKQELANLLSEGARYAEAETLYEEILAAEQRAHGDEDPRVARLLNSMALMENARGKYELAIEMAAKAESIFLREWGGDYPELAWSYHVLATANRQLREFESSRKYYSHALESFSRSFGPDHATTLRSKFGYATLLQRTGELRAAADLASAIVERRRELLGEHHADTCGAEVLLGSIQAELGDLGPAKANLERAYETLKVGINREHPEVARVIFELGMLYKKTTEFALALSAFEQAHAIRLKALGSNHQDTQTAWQACEDARKELQEPSRVI